MVNIAVESGLQLIGLLLRVWETPIPLDLKIFVFGSRRKPDLQSGR